MIARARVNLSRGYELIVFDEAMWEPGVKRYLINVGGGAVIIGGNEEAVAPSGVRRNDVRICIEDDRDWMVERDLGWWRRVYYAMLPWENEQENERSGLWKRMEVLGGRKGKWRRTVLSRNSLLRKSDSWDDRRHVEYSRACLTSSPLRSSISGDTFVTFFFLYQKIST